MKKRNWRRYEMMISHSSTLILLTVLTAMFAYLWYGYYRENMLFETFKNKGNLLIILIYAALLYTFSHIYGAYKIGYFRVSEIVYSQFIALCFTNIIAYFQVILILRHRNPPWPMMILAGVEFAVAVVWALLMNKLYFRLHPAREMIILYSRDGAKTLDGFLEKLATRPEKFNVKKSLCFEEAENFPQELAGYDAVLLYDIDAGQRSGILKYCFEKGIRVYLTPKLSDIILRGADNLNLFDTPLLLSRNRGLSYEQRLLKRSFDLVVAGLMTLLLSPLMFLIAAAVYLYDRGPVFFRQERLTLGGKTFRICKFRSMVVGAEKDGVARLSCKNDDRITPVGKILRKTRLDELPQLFNILKGDMSIVGPRPERPEIAAQYRKLMPEFDYRLKVKGGLTGEAQLEGKYNTTPYDKLKMDLNYIENYSLMLDIKIMLRTAKVFFMKESTEGVDDILPG